MGSATGMSRMASMMNTPPIAWRASSVHQKSPAVIVGNSRTPTRSHSAASSAHAGTRNVPLSRIDDRCAVTGSDEECDSIGDARAMMSSRSDRGCDGLDHLGLVLFHAHPHRQPQQPVCDVVGDGQRDRESVVYGNR